MADKKPKTAEQPARRKPGRPPRSPENPGLRTPELADAIADGISRGIMLTEICRGRAISVDVVHLWRAQDIEFDRRIARARVTGFDAIAEQCVQIADTRENGPDDVQHRKLQIETRLKLLAKWDPKRYGDKVEHAVTGADGGPVQNKLTIEYVRPKAAKGGE